MCVDCLIGILLLLWFIWWVLWLVVGGLLLLWILFVFIVGVWLMCLVGCVINDYVDWWLDLYVKCIKDCFLVSGVVFGCVVLVLFVVLMLVVFVLVLILNVLIIGLSFIGVFLVVSYFYLKCYIYLLQVYLGMVFGWGILMVFVVVQGEILVIGWLLYGVNILWFIVYDIWYVMVDCDDDLKMGLYFIVILFGDFDLVIQGILYVLFLGVMVLVGVCVGLGGVYWVGVVVVVGLIVYEFWIVCKCEWEFCFKVFLYNNWVGVVLFVGIVVVLVLG